MYIILAYVKNCVAVRFYRNTKVSVNSFPPFP